MRCHVLIQWLADAVGLHAKQALKGGSCALREDDADCYQLQVAYHSQMFDKLHPSIGIRQCISRTTEMGGVVCFVRSDE